MNIEKLARHLKEFTLDEIEMIAECGCKTELEHLLNEGKIVFEQNHYKYIERNDILEYGMFAPQDNHTTVCMKSKLPFCNQNLPKTCQKPVKNLSTENAGPNLQAANITKHRDKIGFDLFQYGGISAAVQARVVVFLAFVIFRAGKNNAELLQGVIENINDIGGDSMGINDHIILPP